MSQACVAIACDTESWHETCFIHGWRSSTMIGTVLLVVLILMLLGALPAWPHSKSWGYAPTGALGTALVIVFVLVLIGRI